MDLARDRLTWWHLAYLDHVRPLLADQDEAGREGGDPDKTQSHFPEHHPTPPVNPTRLDAIRQHEPCPHQHHPHPMKTQWARGVSTGSTTRSAGFDGKPMFPTADALEKP